MSRVCQLDASSTPDGHSGALTYQRIVCFACPSCYLLFNLRDECLQHMAAKNHFSESLPLAGKSPAAALKAGWLMTREQTPHLHLSLSLSRFLKKPKGGLSQFLSRST